MLQHIMSRHNDVNAGPRGLERMWAHVYVKLVCESSNELHVIFQHAHHTGYALADS